HDPYMIQRTSFTTEDQVAFRATPSTKAMIHSIHREFLAQKVFRSMIPSICLAKLITMPLKGHVVPLSYRSFITVIGIRLLKNRNLLTVSPFGILHGCFPAEKG